MSIKPIVGNIPEYITYLSSSTKKLESYWENDALHAGWIGQEVIPAFCSDSTNLKTLETGRAWANGWWNKDKSVIKEVNFKNDPIKKLKIISLERRSEGGRAYKVVTSDNFYFDLREDVLMDTMINVGISKNGLLNGDYIWARVGSEMKLVRVGSALYEALLVSTADRTLKKLGYGDLKVGHIYKGKGKDQYIFIGYVDCSDCEFEQDRYIYGRMPPVLTRKEIRNGLLLFKYNENLKINLDEYFFAEVKTSHSFVKDCGQVLLPENTIDIVSNAEYKQFTKSLDMYNSYNTNRDIINDKLQTFSYHSDIITARKSGEPERKFEGFFPLDRFGLTETITKKIK